MTGFSPSAAARRRRLHYLTQLTRGSTVPDAVAESTLKPVELHPAAVPSPRKRKPYRPLAAALADRSVPLAWVFTGEVVRGVQEAGLDVPLSGLAGVCIRDALDRPADAFVDTTGPGLRIADLLRDFERRVERFHPDVLVISTTLRESIRGINGLERFERLLVNLVQHCRSHGCEVVLLTPMNVTAESAAHEVDQHVYIEATRGIAAEHDIPLVDLWQDGERLQEQQTDQSAHTLLRRFARDLRLVRPKPADSQERLVAAIEP